MIPMPYILVNMVLDVIGWILFCTTSATLLSKYSLTNRYLPPRLRRHRVLAFIAHGLVLLALSFAALRLMESGKTAFRDSRGLFEVFFYIGVANVVILTFQFLDRRYFLGAPKGRRRLLIATLAVVLTAIAVIVVINGVVLAFTIR